MQNAKSVIALLLFLTLASAPRGYAHEHETGHPAPPAPPAPEGIPAPAAASKSEGNVEPSVDPLAQARELIDAGKPSDAIPLLVNYLRGKPEETEGQFLLGEAFLFSANEVRAQEIFGKIAADRPEASDRVTKVFFQAGDRLIRAQGKRHIGMHYLNFSLQRDPSRGAEAAVIFHDTGLETVSENRWLAHQLLGRALELNPGYEDDDQFFAAYRVETAAKDAEILAGGETFLQRFPKSLLVPRVLFKMGEASLNTGKRTEARGYFKRLAEEFPDTEFGQKAKGRLQGL
ncbi:MAG: tetratricopeptide repeat protein [Nitrospirae bacterium]|nr:tetratricopeptide repeat protein [Nitrospirota bacterium]